MAPSRTEPHAAGPSMVTAGRWHRVAAPAAHHRRPGRSPRSRCTCATRTTQYSWGLCPSAALGFSCPGCGGLRAVNDLTHGDVGAGRCPATCCSSWRCRSRSSRSGCGPSTAGAGRRRPSRGRGSSDSCPRRCWWWSRSRWCATSRRGLARPLTGAGSTRQRSSAQIAMLTIEAEDRQDGADDPADVAGLDLALAAQGAAGAGDLVLGALPMMIAGIPVKRPQHEDAEDAQDQ